MIYRYTPPQNGAHYHGLVVEDTGAGWWLLLDAHQLPRGEVTPARLRWISKEPSQYTLQHGQREFLPLETRVQWNDARVRRIAQAGAIPTVADLGDFF